MSPQKVRILLIEDDPDDAELVLESVGNSGCPAEVAHERLLTLGLRRIEAEDFDLLLLDLSLPDSWGIETLRRVRKAFPNLPVVLMTGAAMAEIAEEAKREGAVECLFKQELDAGRLAGILSVMGQVCLFYALSLGEVVIVSPLSSTSQFFVLFLAAVFLRKSEVITGKIVLGTILIAGATVFLALLS